MAGSVTRIDSAIVLIFIRYEFWNNEDYIYSGVNNCKLEVTFVILKRKLKKVSVYFYIIYYSPNILYYSFKTKQGKAHSTNFFFRSLKKVNVVLKCAFSVVNKYKISIDFHTFFSQYFVDFLLFLTTCSNRSDTLSISIFNVLLGISAHADSILSLSSTILHVYSRGNYAWRINFFSCIVVSFAKLRDTFRLCYSFERHFYECFQRSVHDFNE